MSKKYKNKQCVYCLKRISFTRDHVIAKEFFPINIRNEPIPTVPSCNHCHKLWFLSPRLLSYHQGYLNIAKIYINKEDIFKYLNPP